MLIFGVIVAAVLAYIILTYNQIVRSRIKCEEALSGIDVALAKRFDSLTNIVETVKGYARHEQEVLIQLTRLRASMTLAEKEGLAAEYDQAQNRLMMLAESYPELKASENFMQLQRTIADVEEHLQAARRAYNANVSGYNQRIQMFPAQLIAGMMNAGPKPFFQAQADQTETPKIQL